jgi:uridine phosphorylase
MILNPHLSPKRGFWEWNYCLSLNSMMIKKAVIEASNFVQKAELSECCVMPIYPLLIKKLVANNVIEPIPDINLAPFISNIYRVVHHGKPVTVIHPGIGASVASTIMEILIALGYRKFVACGSAGVLRSDIKRGSVVIPESALRDEGTSFHYHPPSRYIHMNLDVRKTLEKVLLKHGIDYTVGRTWTTDALFRETRNKIKQRISEGCITVEMECSALTAVAAFRDVQFGQYLEAADDVCKNQWDRRELSDIEKIIKQESIFWLSVEAVLSL